eukprot:TRINITY_DN3069_c0_g1_i1.p1 TRINITY_DN3069_c0_g1~~TRINITY_DN3069_c0_g1_i1.p1  ORF type:complete len:388 (+),score=115.62 TRINITY_DN3069_c0_g1_i1:83-1165(+)
MLPISASRVLLQRSTVSQRTFVASTRPSAPARYQRESAGSQPQPQALYLPLERVRVSERERSHWLLVVAAAVGAGVVGLSAFGDEADAASPPVDYDAVRKDIEAILEDPSYDDGSYGPILLRLAWHAAGTYDKSAGNGGSDGATMRFHPESDHGANAGLGVARSHLESIAKKHPGISTADLWSLAGVVAIEAMGGPEIKWRPGRVDKEGATHCTPDGRLPDASQGPQHLRQIFGRMGFSDREIVALSGAHALGRCHSNRSGFDGPWTNSPTFFSNDYYVQLMERKWTARNWNGPLQYEDETKSLMMLPTDLALVEDPEFRKYVELYQNDEEAFFNDFAKAFTKLQENGVAAFAKSWYQFW